MGPWNSPSRKIWRSFVVVLSLFVPPVTLIPFFSRTSLFHTRISLPQLSFPRPNEGHHCEEMSQPDDTVHTTPWDIHDDPASHSESWLLISQTTEDPEVLPTSRVTVACQTTASPQPLYEKPRPNLEKNRLLHRTEALPPPSFKPKSKLPRLHYGGLQAPKLHCFASSLTTECVPEPRKQPYSLDLQPNHCLPLPLLPFARLLPPYSQQSTKTNQMLREPDHSCVKYSMKLDSHPNSFVKSTTHWSTYQSHCRQPWYWRISCVCTGLESLGLLVSVPLIPPSWSTSFFGPVLFTCFRSPQTKERFRTFKNPNDETYQSITLGGLQIGPTCAHSLTESNSFRFPEISNSNPVWTIRSYAYSHLQF